jgi:alpha-galactosidase
MGWCSDLPLGPSISSSSFSSQAIALMNTSPSNHTLNIEMNDLFWDMSVADQQATWQFYDLWAKDAQGKWGKSLGTFTKTVPGVQVRPHAVRVWKAVMKQTKMKRDASEM